METRDPDVVIEELRAALEEERALRVRAEEALRTTRVRLEALANRDTLTGIWNRRAILQRLEAEVARARRQHESLALGMLDLDRFKQVNDRYGHPVGDVVLRETIARASAVLRPYDDLGRYGGEEFLLVLSRAEADAALLVAERICAAVAARPVVDAGHEVPVTVSIGVAVLREEESAQQLLVRADRALYVAKDAGRDRVALAP